MILLLSPAIYRLISVKISRARRNGDLSARVHNSTTLYTYTYPGALGVDL